jgi:hypothetical protein
MTKFGKFDDYPPRSLESAEAALLTAWRSLEQYHNDLVLVGGLAVHYLTRRDISGLPGAVTLDVDFGITLGASGGQYGTIKTDLAGLGFTSEGNRLVRKFGDIALYLDFLTEDPPSVTGARVVDDVVASVIPGVNRALASRRIMTVHDPARQTQNLPCAPGQIARATNRIVKTLGNDLNYELLRKTHTAARTGLHRGQTAFRGTSETVQSEL